MDDDILIRIEKKLDMIIDYFHIGQKPPRSIRDIEKEVEAKIMQLQARKAERAKRKPMVIKPYSNLPNKCELKLSHVEKCHETPPSPELI